MKINPKTLRGQLSVFIVAFVMIVLGFTLTIPQVLGVYIVLTAVKMVEN